MEITHIMFPFKVCHFQQHTHDFSKNKDVPQAVTVIQWNLFIQQYQFGTFYMLNTVQGVWGYNRQNRHVFASWNFKRMFKPQQNTLKLQYENHHLYFRVKESQNR